MEKSGSYRNPLHLTLGASAAGCVRAACSDHGVPGTVVGIQDDLSHGPLDDGIARSAYLRACHAGYDECQSDSTDAFTPWRELNEHLDREQPDAIVIWAGDNVAEATFLAMACAFLTGRPEPLLLVTVTSEHGHPYVAVYAPEALARLFESRHLISVAGRACLVTECARIRNQTGLLRRWENGRVIGVPLDYYDPLLLGACGAKWTSAARVIGTALGLGDSRNLLNDLFLCSRLQVLIDTGLMKADRPRTTMRDYAVRKLFRL
jgi:hypothetical protein